MTSEPHAALSDATRWAAEARRELANLGFNLVEGSPPRESAHLLVALRAEPTLEHYDPEEIAYWVTEGGRGRAARLDRDTRFPLDGKYAWGRITLTDRLGVANQFLSFGGTVRAQLADDSTAIVAFGSVAPILRWSGHSQGLDPLTAEVGAFFGRMKVPIDFNPGAEDLVSRAAPRTLYCAFIQNVRERLAQRRSLRDANRWLSEWEQHQGQQMEAEAADDWRAGQELRQKLGLGEAAGSR